MRRGAFWMIAAAAIVVGASPECARAENARVENIRYLHGVPGYPDEMRGVLRVTAEGLVFASGQHDRFTLDGDTVDYVAAEAQARKRALMADIGYALAFMATALGASSALALALEPPTPILDLRGIFLPLLGAAPLLYVLREQDTNLLTVEYLEGESEIRRLAVFRVRKNSAHSVKTLIDQTLGLTAEHYRDTEQKEEAQRQEYERRAAPAGVWGPSRNTVIGKSKRSQILVEKGRYDVLLSPRYVGLRPEGMSWAKYRVPIRKVKDLGDTPHPLRPMHKDGRLVGFEVGRVRLLFY